MTLNKEDWLKIEKNLIGMLTKSDNSDEWVYFLELGMNNYSNATGTSLSDEYMIIQAVYLAIFKEALELQKYEILSLLRDSMRFEMKVRKKVIESGPKEEKEYLLDEWYYSNEYYNDKIKELLKIE